MKKKIKQTSNKSLNKVHIAFDNDRILLSAFYMCLWEYKLSIPYSKSNKGLKIFVGNESAAMTIERAFVWDKTPVLKDHWTHFVTDLRFHRHWVLKVHLKDAHKELFSLKDPIKLSKLLLMYTTLP